MATQIDFLTRKNIFLVGGIVLAAIVIFAGVKFYDLGYRLSLSQGFTRPAQIVISPFTQGAQLFLNGERVWEAEIAGDTLTLKVPAGLHEVATARERYSPWTKSVDVESGERVVVGPFNIPETTNGSVLPKTAAEYTAATQLLPAAAKIPTESSPIVSRDDRMEAFVRGQSLVARVKSGTPPQYFCEASCETEKSIVTLAAEVRGLAFLPGRSDVLLMAVQDGVFAIELDTRGIQNFQVLYRGIKPAFAVSPEGLVYIKEGDSVFKVFLFPSDQ